MSEQGLETLSAFLDGEEVTPEQLAEALQEDGAREALIDWVVVRAALKEDRSGPGAEWYRSMTDIVTRRSVPWWRRTVRVSVAALLGVSVLGGALLVSFSLRGQRDEAVPAAVRVLRFERGVDWHEGW